MNEEVEELGFTCKYEMKPKLSLQQKLLPHSPTSCGKTKSKTSDYSSVFLVLVKRDQTWLQKNVFDYLLRKGRRVSTVKLACCLNTTTQ